MSKNKRVKQRCCYRLKKGKRAGLMCGEWIACGHFNHPNRCIKHVHKP